MYEIFQMQQSEIPELLTLWHEQYLNYCNDGVFPDFWKGGNETIENFLKTQIENSLAIVAKKDGKIVGFMAWMYFDFHNERSAFCPIVGHATVAQDRSAVYHALYTNAAKKWVKDNRFNHLWMIFNDDRVTKDMLYDIGFGSYVIDACAKALKIQGKAECAYSITKARDKDVDLLKDLVEESIQYYRETPIFLKRSGYTKQDISDIIEQDTLFIAWDKDNPIGFINFSVNSEYNTESLASPNSGLISKLGVYIKPEYRGAGLGKCLLSEVANYCAEKEIPYLHVSFETANPFANSFWRKYFKPIVLSVRRTVNKDANFTW